MNIDFEKYIGELVRPLVLFPEEIVVKIFSEEDDSIIVQLMVNEEDKGRVIGKNGRIITAIKTLAYASASKYGKKIEITVDSF